MGAWVTVALRTTSPREMNMKSRGGLTLGRTPESSTLVHPAWSCHRSSQLWL